LYSALSGIFDLLILFITLSYESCRTPKSLASLIGEASPIRKLGRAITMLLDTHVDTWYLARFLPLKINSFGHLSMTSRGEEEAPE
jgi:hypothetical protein